VAAAICQKFLRADMDAHAAEDPDTQMMLAAHLQAGDAMVGISHSGRSITVLNTLREARERGATTIAVTNYPRSPMAKRADIVLLTADFAEDLNGEVVSKRISEHCILESLYICRLMGAPGAPGARAQERSRRAVNVYKAERPQARAARKTG
jgi:DNA-binding MurR/RpiR family transcriptional regulator